MTPAGPVFGGRIALVTGASRGIGRAATLALAQAGAHVVAVARTVGGLEELDDDIRKQGGSATLVPLDLKDVAGIDRMGQWMMKARLQAQKQLDEQKAASTRTPPPSDSTLSSD